MSVLGRSGQKEQSNWDTLREGPNIVNSINDVKHVNCRISSDVTRGGRKTPGCLPRNCVKRKLNISFTAFSCQKFIEVDEQELPTFSEKLTAPEVEGLCGSSQWWEPQIRSSHEARGLTTGDRKWKSAQGPLWMAI